MHGLYTTRALTKQLRCTSLDLTAAASCALHIFTQKYHRVNICPFGTSHIRTGDLVNDRGGYR